MSKLAQSFGLDLTYALARHSKLLTHFFESVIGLFADSEAHAQHLLFARGERCENLSGLLLQINIHHSIRWRDDTLVFYEITEMAILLLANGGFQRNRLFGNLEDLTHFVQWNFHFAGNFFGRRFASDLLDQVNGRANKVVDCPNHMDRYANGSRLVSNRPCDGLANPPRRISRKFVAPLIFELIHGFH